MSLFALPVTLSDITTLQSGIQFFTNPTEAAAEVQAINLPGSTETLFTYAARLIQNNVSLRAGLKNLHSAISGVSA